MIKSGLVQVHSDGRPFNAGGSPRELKEGVMKAARGHVERVARSIVCLEHHQSATVRRTASGWEIRG